MGCGMKCIVVEGIFDGIGSPSLQNTKNQQFQILGTF